MSARLRTAALAVAVGVLEHAATASGQVAGLVMDEGLVPIAGARVSVQISGVIPRRSAPIASKGRRPSTWRTPPI